MNNLNILPGTDCSEIAEVLLDTAGSGQILVVTGQNGSKLQLPEYGQTGQDFEYHEVFTDGKYVYDPRLSSKPVPLGNWTSMIRKLNPGAIIK